MAVVSLDGQARSDLLREREMVADRVAALRAQADRVRALADRLDGDLQRVERRLREMDELLGLAPQLPLESVDAELSGRRLRAMAVDVLRSRTNAGDVVHYRDWYGFVVAEGARVGGQDPLATFLTQVSRASEVESVRPRSGLYRLRSA